MTTRHGGRPNTGEALPRSLLAGMILAALLTPFGSTSIAVALPGIGREFGAGRTDLNLWLVVTYLLVALVGQGPGGRLGDGIAHERGLLAGLGLHALGAALGCCANGLPSLALSRILAAAGGAVVLPSAMALLGTRVPDDRRARMFGLLGGALGLAAALGPPAGARLVEAFGWRSLFAFNLPLVAVAMVLVQRSARRARVPEAHGARGPVFDVQLFRRPAFSAGSGLIALQNLALYGILFLLPASAAAAAHRPAGGGQTPGPGPGPETLLFGMLAGVVIGPPLGGWLAERAGARRAALSGSLLTVAGIVIAHGLEPGAPHLPALIGLALVGTGLGIASSPAQASAMSAAAAHRAGSAAGTLSTMRYLGGLAGIALINAAPGALVLQHAWLAATGAAALLSLRLPGRAA